ncbi:MAG: LysM peptidoglycan-binding domain-containing protein, partial [Acidimicrobiales bacterium]
MTARPSAPRPPDPVAAAAPTVRVAVRRRRSGAVLVAVFAVLAVAAGTTGSAGVWAAAAAAGALGVGYAGLVMRLRRLATEREMALAFVRDSGFDWERYEAELRSERVAAADGTAGSEVSVGDRDLARFVAAYILGWLVTPLVAVARLAGGDVGDLRDHPVLARLVEVQQGGRTQSLRLLAAGVVATAGVGTVGGLVGPAVASASTATTATSSASYTVQAGDTLGAIAARYGTTVGALAAANGIGDVNLIFAGQVLAIPAPAGSPAPAAAPSSGTYTVRAGDTLSAIAARYGTTVSQLTSLNGLADPNLIVAGEVLELGSTAAAPAETTTATRT